MSTYPILSLRNEDLKLLDAGEATRFFGRLLWAEATRQGFTRVSKNVSQNIYTPDGGVDASIEIHDGWKATSIIPNRLTCYQIKTGASFKPWEEYDLQEELFGRKKLPKRENLGSGVRDCLDKEGAYVLVTFGHDLVKPKRDEATQQLENLLNGCGYENPHVEVWSLNQLIDFVEQFPSLVLRARRLSDSPFKTHQEWAAYVEMRKPFFPGPDQQALISNLRTELQRDDRPVHINVRGEPGIGKTRLVLEATAADELGPLVIYSTAERFEDSDLMYAMIRSEGHAIIVLDECDPLRRSRIWKTLETHHRRLKLVSIYSEADVFADVAFFDVPPLEDQHIIEIIRAYDIPEDQASKWPRLCGGSPRMAHMVGHNLKNNPEDMLRPPSAEEAWERFIAGSDDPSSGEVRDRLLVLQHIALFKRFGFGPTVIKEAQAIAEKVQEANPLITWHRFEEVIHYLKERKILQGENTLYITPKLLHI